MQSLNEIDDILEKTFGKKNSIKQEEFSKIIENSQSDVYLQILCFLYQKKPFKSQNVHPLKASKKKVNFFPTSKKSSPNLISGFSGEHTQKKFITPSKKSTLSPAEAFIASANIKEDFLNPTSKTSFMAPNTPFLSGMKGMVRMNNQIVPNENKNNNNFDDVVKNSKYILNSPSKFLKKGKKNDLDNFDVASNLIKMENLNLDVDSDSSSDDEGESKRKKKIKEEEEKKKKKMIKKKTKFSLFQFFLQIF